MSLKTNLMALIVLGLSSHAAATDGHGGLVCPASCIHTVTVTSTASCAEPTSTLQSSATAYLETYTNAGPYVNASVTESSAQYSTIPYTIEATSTIDASSTRASNFTVSYTPSADPAVSSETNGAVSTATLFASLSSSTAPAISTTKPRRCHHNNCLRQFIRHPQVSDFCATYTTTINTATTNLPDYVSQCHADPTRISSACSCIATKITSHGPTSTDPHSAGATSTDPTSADPTSTKLQTTRTAGGVFTYPANPPTDSTSTDPTSADPASTKPQTTRTAGGAFTYPADPFPTAEGCTVPSVVFETFTMTTTISVTVSADTDVSTSVDASETEIESVTSPAAVTSVTSVAYTDSSSASLGTSTR